MPATKTDLVIEQGTTYSHGWAVTVDGEPIDDTWTARGQIRASVGSNVVLHNFSAHVTPEGAVVISVPAGTSSGWGWRKGVYDVEAVHSSGVPVLRVAGGKVEISPEVTR